MQGAATGVLVLWEEDAAHKSCWHHKCWSCAQVWGYGNWGDEEVDGKVCAADAAVPLG